MKPAGVAQLAEHGICNPDVRRSTRLTGSCRSSLTKAPDGSGEDAGSTPVFGLYEFWDVGEEFVTRPPNLGKSSTARVLQALVTLRGKLHDSVAFGTGDMPPHCRDVVYRISLPLGSKERFEEMTGYILTRPPTIKGA